MPSTTLVFCSIVRYISVTALYLHVLLAKEGLRER